MMQYSYSYSANTLNYYFTKKNCNQHRQRISTHKLSSLQVCKLTMSWLVGKSSGKCYSAIQLAKLLSKAQIPLVASDMTCRACCAMPVPT